MQLLRHTGALCFLAAGEFVLMTALEFFVFRRLSGGLPSLDLRFAGFDGEAVTQWLGVVGPQGAETILVWHYMTFDLVFPALLSLALASVIVRLGSRLPGFVKRSDTARAAFALAVVAPYTLADYGQNFAVARLLQSPFAVDPAAVNLASGLVVAKFALGAIPFLVIALFLLAGQKGRQRPDSRSGEGSR